MQENVESIGIVTGTVSDVKPMWLNLSYKHTWPIAPGMIARV